MSGHKATVPRHRSIRLILRKWRKAYPVRLSPAIFPTTHPHSQGLPSSTKPAEHSPVTPLSHQIQTAVLRLFSRLIFFTMADKNNTIPEMLGGRVRKRRMSVAADLPSKRAKTVIGSVAASSDQKVVAKPAAKPTLTPPQSLPLHLSRSPLSSLLQNLWRSPPRRML